MAKETTAPQSVQVHVTTNAIQVPDVEPGERLTRAQHEAWALWAREVINGENVEAEIEPDVFIAFLQWRKLMNDRAFCLVPMNSAEFRTSLAGRLPPNDRRRIVELAGLTIAEAMQLSFPEIVNSARRNIKSTAKNQVGQAGHSKNKIPPEDVQEINRMMKLKRWQGKTPIEICRAYIRGKYKNATEDFVETQAQSLKRKRNRY